jgi:putative flippase GtrA
MSNFLLNKKWTFRENLLDWLYNELSRVIYWFYWILKTCFKLSLLLISLITFKQST